jgi:hypothetical protein
MLAPRDYRSARIGLRPSSIHEATMRALGADVVHVAGAQSLDGLDGTESDFATVDWARYDQQSRSMTSNVVLWPRAVSIVMNRDAWERLTEQQRRVLTDASNAAIGEVMRRERANERGGGLATCSSDFSLVRARPAEVAQLRRAVAPVYRQLDDAARLAVEQIRAIKANLPAASLPACGSGTPRASGPVEDRLVGRWVTTVTAAQLDAVPREPNEQVENNWGRLTLALGADGNFELLNDRYPGAPVGLGSWSSDDGVLTFKPEGSLSEGAGETWRYRWTLFRGTLVLAKVRGGPTALTVAPLTRH